MPGNTCDVCGRSPVMGVANSGLGPLSLAYCAVCLANFAEPFGLALQTVRNCGGLKNCRADLPDLLTWVDGKYWRLEDAIRAYLEE